MPDRARGGFVRELKRRKVFRVAGVYAVAGWALIQVADVVFPRLALPDWTVTFVVVLALLGFSIAVILAGAFEVTPDGVQRSPSEPPGGAGSTRATTALHDVARVRERTQATFEGVPDSLTALVDRLAGT